MLMPMPCPESQGGNLLRVKLQDLPCGGCPYCTRAQSNWSTFDKEVDDVVPLAHKPQDQTVSGGQAQTVDEKGPRVAEVWVSTGEVGTRLREERVKEVKVVQEATGIGLLGPGRDALNAQQKVDPELAWVVQWRETGGANGGRVAPGGP